MCTHRAHLRLQLPPLSSSRSWQRLRTPGDSVCVWPLCHHSDYGSGRTEERFVCTHCAHLRLQLLPLRHRLPGCGLMMLHYSSLVLGSVNGRARRPQDTGPHFGPRRTGVNSVVSGVNRAVCDCFGACHVCV